VRVARISLALNPGYTLQKAAARALESGGLTLPDGVALLTQL